MRFLRILSFCLFPLFLSSAYADEVVTAQKAVSGDTLALQDGRTLRLAGIKAASPEAKGFLDSVSSSRMLVLQDASADRYGRVVATATIQGQTTSLQDALLGEGLAYVYPVSDDARLGAWMEAERSAREKRRGFWAEHEDVSSQKAAALIGKFGFISGAVSKAERVKNKVFLSFGAPEHPDFTVVIAARYLRPLKKLGIDALALKGEAVRVRGWVSGNEAPTVTIATPHQIESSK